MARMEVREGEVAGLRVEHADKEEEEKTYNEEIIQNRVNEVETKMRAQAEGVKKFAEELLKIEQKCRKTEARKKELEGDCQKYEQKILAVSGALREESLKAGELHRTVEPLQGKVARLEQEGLMRKGVEQEFEAVSRRLAQEQEPGQKIKVLERVLSQLSGQEKENRREEGGLSRQELEAALLASRPTSRRRRRNHRPQLSHQNHRSRPQESHRFHLLL